ncbi:hypothetical protein RND81_09G166900 [Saponaria officinalis]|uniref:CCHC-type domain-containing protein n=1 Tax=Saponaria officinalis TaxID=3572 RepID=A0AAW1INN3_SAPOF
MPRSHWFELVSFNPEPERILRARRNLNTELVQAEDLSTLDTTYEDFTFENPSYEEETFLISESAPPDTKMPKLSSHSEPTIASIPKGFKLPATTAGTFEIRPAFINLLERSQFGGSAAEDPGKHLVIFTDYCSTLSLAAGVTADKIKQLLFLFSLRDSAREWITDLDKTAAEITDWTSLALAFYKKYYPPQKTNPLRAQIINFRQFPFEDLNEAWIRFKRLVRSVPHHGFPDWLLCNQFYNSLYDDHRAILDSAANGRFQNNTDDDKAWNLIEEMATHTAEYRNMRGNSRKNGSDLSELATQIEALHAKLDKLEGSRSLGGVRHVHAMVQQEATCERCGTRGHSAVECMTSVDQVLAFQKNQQAPPYTPRPPVHNNPPSFTPPVAFNPPPSSSNTTRLEDMIQALMTQFQKSDNAKDASIKMLENQVSQLAANQKARRPGTLPSQLNNLHETANAIYLHSGTSYRGPEIPPIDAEKNEALVEDETDLIMEEIEETDQYVTEPTGIKCKPIGPMSEPIGTNDEPIGPDSKPIGTPNEPTSMSALEKNKDAAEDIVIPSYTAKPFFPNQQRSLPRKRNKLKRSFTLVNYAPIISWYYLYFCLAHAQFFDRLLRALSCFDYGQFWVIS